MAAVFTVDQAATFRQVFFMSCEPKVKFGSGGQQEVNADGVPRWEVQVVATFDRFGRAENEVLKVGVVSHNDPGAALGNMPQPVQLVNFRVGVMPVEVRKDNQGREKITGGTAFYQADEVRSTMQAAPAARKSAEG